MRTHTEATQSTLTPDQALTFLKEGNDRFRANLKANRNLLQQVNETSRGQFPFAAILSCIDSRTSAELIFDQGLGDIFSVRIAGNFANDDILGSLEYACLVAGSKLILVLGHTHCGAVTAACKGSADGHIGQLLEKLHPAVEVAKQSITDTEDIEVLADKAAEVNVRLTIEQIRKRSPALQKLEQEGKIQIAGGVYDVANGGVHFLDRTSEASDQK